jgi:Undecaprenyl-phosphate glucose phosphotransferase
LERSNPFKNILLIGDLIFLNAAYAATLFWSFHHSFSSAGGRYIEMLLVQNIAWIISGYLINLYSLDLLPSLENVFKKLLNALALYLIIIFAYLGVRDYPYDKLFVFQSYCATSLGIGFFYISMHWLLIHNNQFFKTQRRVIIVGYGELATELEQFFLRDPHSPFLFLRHFSADGYENQPHALAQQVIQYARTHQVSEIYCILPYLEPGGVQHIIDMAEDDFIEVRLIPDYRGFPYKGVEVQFYEHIPILDLRPIPLDDSFNRFLKRCFDIVFTVVILLIFWWLIPLIAIFIKMNSKGPVFYRQRRSGKNNRVFTCYKFRTMYQHSEPEHKQAVAGDPRITSVGRFLRKSSLDELPQFLNVMRGEMSIVGPRPHPVKLNEQYRGHISKFMLRHSVKPGITGLAQVKGFRGETQTIFRMKNRVKLDRFYVENWSLLFDIKILLLTIASIVRGDENAY